MSRMFCDADGKVGIADAQPPKTIYIASGDASLLRRAHKSLGDVPATGDMVEHVADYTKRVEGFLL